MVGIDRLADFLAGQAAGVDHLAVRRLEVDAVYEVAVHRSAAQSYRLAEQRHLLPDRLHRKAEADADEDAADPRPGGQHDRPAQEAAGARFHAPDLSAID